MTLKEKKINDFSFIIDKESIDTRLDIFLHKQFPIYSRNLFQNLIKEGFITVNDKNVKPGYKLKEKDKIIGQILVKNYTFEKENIPIEILYEDEYIVAINKKAGMVVHPAAGHYHGTVANAIFYQFGENLSGGFANDRPGIIHRLDKDTSGVLLITKTQEAQLKFSELFKNRQIKKNYRAIVWGRFSIKDFTIDMPIGRSKNNRKKMQVNGVNAKNAVSVINTINIYEYYTYINVRILTGRTHQIRVHLNYINHPVIGDVVYGNDKNYLINVKSQNIMLYSKLRQVKRQLLHAYEVIFIHPFLEKEIYIKANIPDDFKILL